MSADVVAADLPPIWPRSQQIRQVLMNLVTTTRNALNDRYPAEGRLCSAIHRRIE